MSVLGPRELREIEEILIGERCRIARLIREWRDKIGVKGLHTNDLEELANLIAKGK